MLNRNIFSSTVLLLGVFSTSVFAEALFYPQYQEALSAPITPNAAFFQDTDINKERLVNIVLSQSKRVTRSSSEAFLSNVELMIERQDMVPWHSVLLRAKVNALMLTGQFKVALDTIEQMPTVAQEEFRLLSAVAYLEMGKEGNAIERVNGTMAPQYSTQQEQYLMLAQDMVVNYGVASRNITLPADGDVQLAQRLANFYKDGGFYDKAYREYVRLMSKEKEASKRQDVRITLVDFAREHDLVRFEVDMMEAYLKEQASLLVTLPEADQVRRIHDYSNKLVLYFSDHRNKRVRKPQEIESLLISQKQLGELDEHSQIAYLKNRTYLYRKSRPSFFYQDTADLARLTQDKTMLVMAYNDSLPSALREVLLSAYFSIQKPGPDELFMAKAYLPFVKQCQKNTPHLIRVLKGHDFVQRQNFDEAYLCFGKPEPLPSSLSNKLKKALSQEQRQVAYWQARNTGDVTQMLVLAENGDASMRFDALLEMVRTQPLTVSRLNQIDALTASLDIGKKARADLEVSIIAKLRQGDDKVLLAERLAAEPQKHALELAWLSMEQDDTQATINYLLLRLGQSEPLDAYSLTKTIRYLDGHHQKLSTLQSQTLAHLASSYSTVRRMLAMQKMGNELVGAFPSPDQNVMTAVKQGLSTYQKYSKALSGTLKEPNYTAQLWFQSELERCFVEYLQTILDTAPSGVVGVLEQQINQKQQRRQSLLQQVVSLKIEDVEDERVWLAYQALLEGK